VTPRSASGNFAGGGAPDRRYATISAFEAALKAKLAARVTSRRNIQDLRKYLAFDRVLARLACVAPDAWLLKGGVALEYRLDRARATTDIDISVKIGLDEMIDTLEAAATVELNDYFALRLGEYSKPVHNADTYRFKVSVLYENGRTFEDLAVDIGFADAWLGEPQRLHGPPLLDFAGIEPAVVRVISAEQHLAEKLHAYTRRYGDRDSTRVKDLVDMALLLTDSRIVDAALAQALRNIFSARGTHDVPATLPPPPASWSVAYAKLAAELPIPQTSDEAHRFVADALAGTFEAANLVVADRKGAHPARLVLHPRSLHHEELS
jgi:predicted nucleotidyltransferase component of viral defense system